MSIGLLPNIGGSVAGTLLAQLRGSDVDRAQQDRGAADLRAQSNEKAEMASGVGQADGDDHETAERDADGRQLWQFSRDQAQPDDDSSPPREPRAQDPTGQCGSMLDLSG